MRPGFALRAARSEDQAAIRSLVRRTRINPTGLRWQRFTVAVDAEGRLIGCGQIKPRPGQVEELASLAVESAWRRQGVARAIIHRLQAGRHDPLWLICRAELVPFYRQFGFLPVRPEDSLPPGYARLRRLARLVSGIIDPRSLPEVLVWRPQPLPGLQPSLPDAARRSG